MQPPSSQELKTGYATCESTVEAISAKGYISPSDVDALDRQGRLQVVDTLWMQCLPETRQRLRDDRHPQIRSAVRIAEQMESTLTGKDIKSLMRKHNKTIRDVSAIMNVTLKRVREVREKGVTGRCLVQDWREAITGTGLFKSM